MAGELQPLDQKFAIVGPDGRPTLYFIQWAQQKQIDISGSITADQAIAIIVQYLDEHRIQEGSGIQISPSGNLTDMPTIAADVQEILDQISATRGTLLYRGLLGWAALAPGTAGNILSTNGAGADPSWIPAAAGGSGWTIAEDFTVSAAIASHTVSVAAYDSVKVMARGVTLSVAGTMQILVSDDGGATFWNTAGDYERYTSDGVPNAAAALNFHSTGATAARGGTIEMTALRKTTIPKLARNYNTTDGQLAYLVKNNNAITHLKFQGGGGGNITAGRYITLGQ